MEILTFIFIGFGLAMDAFAVSIASGMRIKEQRLKSAFKFGIYFGSFQMFMPVIGWASGLKLRNSIVGIDHWVAFALLTFIGCKMIYESSKTRPEKRELLHSTYEMLTLSVATSIDALAVGLSFAFLKFFIMTPVIIIGVITFALSFLGVFIGNTIGHFFERKIEVIGGLVLIGIGIKILIEHLL